MGRSSMVRTVHLLPPPQTRLPPPLLGLEDFEPLERPARRGKVLFDPRTLTEPARARRRRETAREILDAKPRDRDLPSEGRKRRHGGHGATS
ncbi:MAG: hypothetical protein HY721_26900 [Planctomycetes bacterium]|nr:hypothetical protein [Planctomycetota bacterium]